MVRQGPNRFALQSRFGDLLTNAQRQLDALGTQLLAEGEVSPSTTAAFSEYSMLTEAGQNKYQTADWLVDNFIHDFDTSNLFVTRAIKLADKEDRPALAKFLVELLNENQRAIMDLQAYLGREARSGLDEDDDEED